MMGIGIGIGIGLTQHIAVAAGPSEVTVAGVRVMSYDSDLERFIIRCTFSDDAEFAGYTEGFLFDGSNGGIAATGSDHIEFFYDNVTAPASYELQPGHGITSLSGPVVATASGSVIPLP